MKGSGQAKLSSSRRKWKQIIKKKEKGKGKREKGKRKKEKGVKVSSVADGCVEIESWGSASQIRLGLGLVDTS